MWELVGPLRTTEGLEVARATVHSWRESGDLTRTAVEDRNLLQVAEAMIAAALARPVSVGAHHILTSARPVSAEESAPALIGV